MKGSLLVLGAGLGALGLLLSAGWLLQQAPSRLDRAVAALSLESPGEPAAELRRPRERHRSERARRPTQRPSRPVTYDW